MIGMKLVIEVDDRGLEDRLGQALTGHLQHATVLPRQVDAVAVSDGEPVVVGVGHQARDRRLGQSHGFLRHEAMNLGLLDEGCDRRGVVTLRVGNDLTADAADLAAVDGGFDESGPRAVADAVERRRHSAVRNTALKFLGNRLVEGERNDALVAAHELHGVLKGKGLTRASDGIDEDVVLPFLDRVEDAGLVLGEGDAGKNSRHCVLLRWSVGIIPERTL